MHAPYAWHGLLVLVSRVGYVPPMSGMGPSCLVCGAGYRLWCLVCVNGTSVWCGLLVLV